MTSCREVRGGIKWILRPGFVASLCDGDIHYISARQLANLYQVSMAECAIVPGDQLLPEHLKDLPQLDPRYRGDYLFPVDEEEDK